MDLSGEWGFCLDADKAGIEKSYFNKSMTDTICLPTTTSIAGKGAENTAKETGSLTDSHLFEGYAWYTKAISLKADCLPSAGRRIKLYLERTRLTTLWINGKEVGSRNSLTTPHEYDITDFVENENINIAILVSNVDYPTKGGHLTSPDTQTNWNGIIGDISLRICNSVYIDRITARPDAIKKTVLVEAFVNNTTGYDVSANINIHAWLCDINGYVGTPLSTVSDKCTLSARHITKVSKTYKLGDNAELWSEYNPKIYELTVSLDQFNVLNPGIVSDGSKPVEINIPELSSMAQGESNISDSLNAVSDIKESLTTTFGLRNFKTTETRFTINGDPTFLRGKHDGLIFPLTGAFPTTVNEWVRVLSISKSYGINHYRYHTCCPPDAAFTAADLVGIYMEPQLPFWGTLCAPGDEYYNETEENYLIHEGYLMLDYYGNHASYCMMSLGNELWGDKNRMAEIMRNYRAYDNRHLYTQGSNNFQHAPLILDEDDFYVGVRFDAFDRHFRGSYGMCDTPLGHIQSDEPSTNFDYDDIIAPKGANTSGLKVGDEIEIQYGTGVKKVTVTEEGGGMLIPHIPVVSHEIGQYCVYPDFREIDKYTGPLKARNFEVFRDRLDKKGMLDQADDFFYASGKLAVDCYKEELESAARSNLIAGYQILDIQDFSGQGTALVGILDAFMDSKGLVSTKDWAGYCSDAILMAHFDSFVLKSGFSFKANTSIRYYRPARLSNALLHWEFCFEGSPAVHDGINRGSGYATPSKLDAFASGYITIPDNVYDLTVLDAIECDMPVVDKPCSVRLTLSIDNTDIINSYEMWLYPAVDMDTDIVIERLNTVSQIPCKKTADLPFGAQSMPEAKEEADNTADTTVSTDSADDNVNETPAANDSVDVLNDNSANQTVASAANTTLASSDEHINVVPGDTPNGICLTYGAHKLYITNNTAEADSLLNKGENVILLPYEVSESIRGFYCDDFWCYTMFSDICNWMKKPVAIGTLGLLIDNTHPALESFPSLKYSTPQWFKLVSHADCAILDDVTDKAYRPIVQMIDNFERNHKLGILFEGHAGSGNLLVCTARLNEISDAPEVRSFIKSITEYALSDKFAPAQNIDIKKLSAIF